MTAVEDARHLIVARLQEIENEAGALKRALKALAGVEPFKRQRRGSGSRSRAQAGKPKTRRKRKSGSRLDQAVAIIERQPGITASEIAKKMKIKPNYLYRVLGEAVKEGRVKKDGRSYSPSGG